MYNRYIKEQNRTYVQVRLSMNFDYHLEVLLIV